MNWIDHKRYVAARRRRTMMRVALQVALTLAAVVVLTVGIGIAMAAYFHVLAVTG